MRKKLPGVCDKSVKAAKRISAKKVESKDVVSFVVDNTVDGAAEKWS